MGDKRRIGIIICDRYKSCSGGKCFRALRNREGAFDSYRGVEVEIAGFTSCGGCPGGNIEYAGEEMAKNGVTDIHLATGFLVGYPPCPSIDYFARFMEERYKVRVVVGTHPIPAKYHAIHERLGTWKGPGWSERLAPSLSNAEIRSSYD
ncbi:MAG TPA: CGGC domain-containing protein [Rectinemataceae bacterium]|nr:CGGC domain-containing protein [Rectinemataceae bacterium]